MVLYSRPAQVMEVLGTLLCVGTTVVKGTHVK